MGGGVRCLFTLFRGGCNGFGLSLLLGGERGKEALTVPPSGSPDSYDPKMLWRIVTNGGERGGIMVANYVAAFVPHGVSMLHSLFHGHRRHRVGEEANGDILWAKFACHWPRRSPWAPSPAPLGSSPFDDTSCQRGGRGASSLVRPNQGVGRPLLGAPRHYLPPRCWHDRQRCRGNVHCLFFHCRAR